MGTGAQAEGDPLCTHPHWQGTTQRSPFFCRHQPGRGKKDLFSLREVAMIMIRTIETWAPQVSTNKQNFHFCKIIVGVGDPIVGTVGLGLGESAPSPSVSASRQLCPHGWTQRGFNTAPSTFSL